jgi:hypothetical protein
MADPPAPPARRMTGSWLWVVARWAHREADGTCAEGGLLYHDVGSDEAAEPCRRPRFSPLRRCVELVGKAAVVASSTMDSRQAPRHPP